MTMKARLKEAANLLNENAPLGERLGFVNQSEEAMLKASGGAGIPVAGDVPSYFPWLPLLAGLGGGMAMGGMMGNRGSVSAPPPRDYGQETRDTLSAQIDLAPELFASEANRLYGRPAYARMEQDMLWDSLLGTGRRGEAGVATLDPSRLDIVEPTTDQLIKSILRPSSVNGVPIEPQYKLPSEVGRATPESMERELARMQSIRGGDSTSRGRGGLLDLYEQHIAPSTMRQQKVAAKGEIDMLRELGPLFIEAQRSADPRSENIRQMLQERAMEGLEARQSLTPEELAGVTESVRSGQAARGEAYQRSQPAMIEETMARLGAGRQAENERIARASALLGQTGQIDPMMGLFGRSARMPGQVAGQLGTSGFALQAGPQLFSPESAYAGALAGSNQANIMNAGMASAANKAAITGGLMQGLGSLGGGMFAGKYFS